MCIEFMDHVFKEGLILEASCGTYGTCDNCMPGPGQGGGAGELECMNVWTRNGVTKAPFTQRL